MMSLRAVAVLLLVAAVVLQVSTAPQPNFVKDAFNKAKAKMSPRWQCLKDAGATDAVFVFLEKCGSVAFFGPFAMAACTATANAPHDVKEMLKASGNCFKQ